MGQLEKYGLYVLCLVIFLILAVTIWPGDVAASPEQRNAAVRYEESALNGGNGNGRSNSGALLDGDGALASRNGGSNGMDLESLLGPARQDERAPVRLDADPVGDDDGGAATNQTGADRERANPDPGTERPLAAAGPTEYTIRVGDTLSEIAMNQLGSIRHQPAILKLNPGLDPKKLVVGKKIRLPGREAVKSSARPSVLQRAGAYRDYTIVRGDTFDRIARVQLGSSSRVSDIRALNPNVSPRNLQVGKKLKLPIE